MGMSQACFTRLDSLTSGLHIPLRFMCS